MRLHRSVLGIAALLVLPVTAAYAAPMKILSAVYGSPPPAGTCNATPALRVCSGYPGCDIYVGNQLCGDPNVLVVKGIAIRYSCRGVRYVATASEYDYIRLLCR